jgi:ketosteroid isomerase-like protein
MKAEDGMANVIDRLVDAVNGHDLAALVGCFAPDYRNETPLHPSRSFQGTDQVRRNWEQIFSLVPDITASIIRSAVDGSTVWTEWEMRGTRSDGSPYLMRGVIIFGIQDDLCAWARFYLEPAQDTGESMQEAVRRLTTLATQGSR